MSVIRGEKISSVGIWEKDELDMFLFVQVTTQDQTLENHIYSLLSGKYDIQDTKSVENNV